MTKVFIWDPKPRTYIRPQDQDISSYSDPFLHPAKKKQALVLEEHDKLPDGTLNYKRKGQWHKYSQHLYLLEKLEKYKALFILSFMFSQTYLSFNL